MVTIWDVLQPSPEHEHVSQLRSRYKPKGDYVRPVYRNKYYYLSLMEAGKWYDVQELIQLWQVSYSAVKKARVRLDRAKLVETRFFRCSKSGSMARLIRRVT